MKTICKIHMVKSCESEFWWQSLRLIPITFLNSNTGNIETGNAQNLLARWPKWQGKLQVQGETMNIKMWRARRYNVSFLAYIYIYACTAAHKSHMKLSTTHNTYINKVRMLIKSVFIRENDSLIIVSQFLESEKLYTFCFNI